MEANPNYWGEFILSLLVLWWLYAGILIIGIIAFIGSDKFVKVISVLLIIAVLVSNMIIFNGYYILAFIFIYKIYITIFVIGITLLLLADGNKIKEYIGMIITIIAMSFMFVEEFARFRPCISIITIGIFLFVVNQQIRKKIAIIFILLPIICYVVGFVSFVFSAINLPPKII